MNVQVTPAELQSIISAQTIRIHQLECHATALQEQLAQAKAETESATVGKESDAETIKKLSEEITASRNGAVAELAG